MTSEKEWFAEKGKEAEEEANKCLCFSEDPDFKKHEDYCPIWKNGRIAELEGKYNVIVEQICIFLAEHELMIEQKQTTEFKSGWLDVVAKEFKELLKHSTET